MSDRLDRLEAACRIVLREVKDETARAYASGAFRLRGEYRGEALKEAIASQAMYLRSNLGKWHGETARRVKAKLDLWAKGKD